MYLELTVMDLVSSALCRTLNVIRESQPSVSGTNFPSHTTLSS